MDGEAARDAQILSAGRIHTRTRAVGHHRWNHLPGRSEPVHARSARSNPAAESTCTVRGRSLKRDHPAADTAAVPAAAAATAAAPARGDATARHDAGPGIRPVLRRPYVARLRAAAACIPRQASTGLRARERLRAAESRYLSPASTQAAADAESDHAADAPAWPDAFPARAGSERPAAAAATWRAATRRAGTFPVPVSGRGTAADPAAGHPAHDDSARAEPVPRADSQSARACAARAACAACAAERSHAATDAAFAAARAAAPECFHARA